MKNLTLLFLASTLLLLSTACNKDDDSPDNPYGLPDATQTGENTFGCLINGEPWVADAYQYWGLEKDVSATYDEVGVGVSDRYYFNITAHYFVSNVDSSNQDYMGIYVRPVFDEGIIDFANLERKDITLYTSLFNISESINIYELDTLFGGNYYNISRLDTISNIIAGEFSFQLISETSLDTLKITKGRFDVKYQPD